MDAMHKYDNDFYHLEMMRSELSDPDFIKDTRGYLSLDRTEQLMLQKMIDAAIGNRRRQLLEA